MGGRLTTRGKIMKIITVIERLEGAYYNGATISSVWTTRGKIMKIITVIERLEGAYYNGELLIAILIKREIKFSFSKKISLKKIEMII